MQSYYDILGVAQNASSQQIKAAFRRLAKLYHPDKNPQGKEQFGKILIAYEVLTDTSRRYQYDLKLKHGNTENFKEKKSGPAKQKEWSFSDEEMKRRQYYKEHYKKEYERYAKHSHVTKKNYNEYKYILFAAPLAVGLLMFVMNATEQNSAEESKKTALVEPLKKDELKMTDDPFTAYFKGPVFDTVANGAMVIKNFSGKDMVVAIYDKDKFLRSAVIKSGFYIEVSQLPSTEMNVKIAAGNNWNKQKAHKGSDAIGGFSDNELYCILNTKNSNGFITINDAALNDLDKITEKEFFEKRK